MHGNFGSPWADLCLNQANLVFSQIGEYPWQAAVLKKEGVDNVYVCAGTLIDHSHLLTAAHCVSGWGKWVKWVVYRLVGPMCQMNGTLISFAYTLLVKSGTHTHTLISWKHFCTKSRLAMHSINYSTVFKVINAISPVYPITKFNISTIMTLSTTRYEARQLRVRLGEWDVNRDTEFYPHEETDVSALYVNPDYYSGNLMNDLAVVRLKAPVDTLRRWVCQFEKSKVIGEGEYSW